MGSFLTSQVPGEANLVNMVAKLSQLTSLLSSIEDKVLGGSCNFSGLLFGPLFTQRMPRCAGSVLPSFTSQPEEPYAFTPTGQGLAA